MQMTALTSFFEFIVYLDWFIFYSDIYRLEARTKIRTRTCVRVREKIGKYEQMGAYLVL